MQQLKVHFLLKRSKFELENAILIKKYTNVGITVVKTKDVMLQIHGYELGSTSDSWFAALLKNWSHLSNILH